MSKKFVEESWRNLLPEVYQWADRVKLDYTNAPPQSALNVIAIKVSGDQPVKKEILAPALAADLRKSLQDLWDAARWHGKQGYFHTLVNGAAYLLVPVTDIRTTPAQIARQFGMDAVKAAREFGTGHVAFCKTEGMSDTDLFDGVAFGLYDAGLFKGNRLAGKKPSSPLPEQISFCGWSENQKAVAKARELAKAAAFTRMLQDAPANYLTPEKFGEIAADMAKDLGLKCSLLGPRELEALGAGSFLSVAAGSASEPRLIAVEIAGQSGKKTVALVGKGLTFDSGGISLKPGLGMGEMKYDMSGGAAVLGAAHFLGKIKPTHHVVCIIGAVENMPGPKATRPGDIVVAMNGKSIDIQNTDAEGRLVLADLLHYANEQHKPDLIVDIATLTGACLHALGHAGAAVMSNDDATAAAILEASKRCGEPLWQLPLWPELEKEVKGEWSDLQNIAKPSVQAGSIMGGLFLAEFVGTTKWAHLDIAGTGWSCKATGYPGSGGSSYGLRLLSELCMS